jgi:hypothetical protein
MEEEEEEEEEENKLPGILPAMTAAPVPSRDAFASCAMEGAAMRARRQNRRLTRQARNESRGLYVYRTRTDRMPITAARSKKVQMHVDVTSCC